MRLRKLALQLAKLIYAYRLRPPMRKVPIVSRGIYPVVYKLWGFLWSKCRPNPVVVEGGLLYLDDSSVIGFSAEVSLYGVYEKGTTCLFREVVREGQTVVDVGAHVGYYTLLAAARAGKSGKVFAFEPDPFLYSYLVKNIGVNGYKNVIPVNKAISSEAGVTKLFLSKMAREDSTMFYRKGFDESILVQTVTLDEFFRGREAPIDLVKIDIEGAEMAALEGMANIIEKNDNLRIITEFVPRNLIRAGVSPTGFLDMIENYGFRIYIIDEEERCMQPVTAAQTLNVCDDRRRRNLFLVKGSQWPSDRYEDFVLPCHFFSPSHNDSHFQREA